MPVLKDAKAVAARCETLADDFVGVAALSAILLAGLYTPLLISF